MFLDRVKIFVHAGAGGDGAATFPRGPRSARAAPTAATAAGAARSTSGWTRAETMLRDFRHNRHFKATPVDGARATSATARPVRISPRRSSGTAIYDDATGELLADLVATGEAAMIARGGRGGLGNVHFATSTHRTPKHAQKGEPDEERWPAGAPADRRCRARRVAERRQVDASSRR